MSRVSKSRTFVETWTDGISPMVMMVFNTNVTRSMQCNIEWNGDDGFELLEGVYKHAVNLNQQKCKTYLKTYSHFIQPVPNMEMWPESRNPIVEPPEAKKMLGMPPNNIRREIGEVRKDEKLPRNGTVMTCSICKRANHNKRNYPKNPKPKSAPTPTQEIHSH
ncbi:hypothetical protein H5410_029096 [Solanum commersonii]|uniref:Uncharacterized protein n=1 Tax=Solanum commersonii TaxID=4109 RepID=A0A9J5Z816_SOLCO|nr:hypothetical protein H5410_029096 [Solanum commersonii]